MELGELLRDEEAVSPVIGAILVVAITVLLAAVTGTVVLGIGDSQQPVPRATFDYEKTELSGQPDELKVYFASGDTIEAENLYLSFESVPIQEESGSPGPADRLSWKELDKNGFGDTIESGEWVWIEPEDSTPELEDKTLQIIWEEDGQTVIIATRKGENV